MKIHTLFAAIILWSLLAPAQDYPIRLYNESDGLPSNLILNLEQAKSGAIWAITRQGIASSNGLTWEVQDTSDIMPGMFWQKLNADQQGGIWVFSKFFRGRLFFWHQGQFHSMDEQLRLTDAMQRNVLCTFLNRGDSVVVCIFYDGQLLSRSYQIQEGKLPLPQEPDWRRYTELSDLEVVAIESFGGQFLIITREKIFAFDGQVIQPSAIQGPQGFSPPQNIISIDTEGKSRIWMMGSDWIGYWERGLFLPILKTEKVFVSPTTLIPDGAGGVIVGDVARILQIAANGKVVSLGFTSNLINKGINHAIQDREKNIWLGGSRGIEKISTLRFANYNQNQGLLQNEITAIAQDWSGNLLLGHNEGLTVCDEDIKVIKTITLPKIDLELGSRVMDLDRGRDYIWGAVPTIGILVFDKELNMRIIPNVSEDFGAFAIKEDRQGRVWIGSFEGIFLLENEVPVHIYQDSIVRRITEGLDGTIYCAVPKHGVLAFDGAWQTISGKTAEENNLYTIIEDHHGRILAGAISQVMIRRGRELVPFLVKGEPIPGPIYSIVQDSKGRLWFGTDRGVLLLEGDRLRRFAVEEGFSGMETNRDAAMVDRLGRVLFGSDRGFSLYHEEFDFKPEEIPAPLVRVRTINGENLLEQQEIPLVRHYQDNDLEFNFEVFSYLSEKGLRYQAYLEGYEKSWLPPQPMSTNKIRYTNLPPGNYHLRLKAANLMGTWSEPASSIPIIIAHPVYVRWWFLGLSFLLLSIFVYYVFDYLTYKRHSVFLEEQVRLRTLELEQKIEEQARAEAEIQALNEDLEDRVQRRTAELEATQRELVESAHHAGMAEIATSIIHNVGNILNSISTSGYLIQNTLERSTLQSFFKANDLLRKNMDNLEQFLLNDPKGHNLLRFYISIEDKLRGENETLSSQVSLLLDKINTIKDVVAQQHNYASGVFQLESLQLQTMVETSLKIMESSLQNKNIRVVTHYSSVPSIRVSKTRLVHTLVNLIKNAAESIAMAGNSNGVITIGIDQCDEQVCIRIHDSGQGIALEHLDKIFSHGFTTKEKGQGFGLHSCANAMQEMGGNIRVESDGPGTGAIFILLFPILQEPQKIGKTPLIYGI